MIPFPTSGELVLLSAPRLYLWHTLPTCIARMAGGNSLRLLDGGNRLNLYGITREIRRYSSRVQDILENIYITRAFTCYQAAALLAEASMNQQPLLVLDLLVTFYDENVSLFERIKLLNECIVHLQRVSETAPVLITNSPPKQQDDPFYKILEESAERTWSMEPPSQAVLPRLL